MLFPIRLLACFITATLFSAAGIASVAQDPQTLRILSYNIHHAEGVDGQLDLQRIADVIRESNPDIVALQEVDQRVQRSKSEDQPQQLGEMLGMHVAFGGNIALEGGHYGNAVLSRFPITQASNHLLPNDDGGEQRGVLQVEFELPASHRMTLLATHLDHRSPNQRLSSVTFINELAESIDHPVCLAGDLNATPDSPVLARLREQWTLSSEAKHPTIPVAKPKRQIDYVLFHRNSLNSDYGVAPTQTRVLDNHVASDHRGIITAWNLYRKIPLSEPITRIVFGSCINQELDLPMLATLAAEHPQLLLMLGDNIYADTDNVEVLRAKYAILSSKPGVQKLLASTRVMETWDDHDFGQNDGGADFPQREAFEKEFLDFWREPTDSVRRKRPGVYEAKTFGPQGMRLQVIMLDMRYFRSPLKIGDKRVGGKYVPDDDPKKTILGAAQWQWLEEQLHQPADVRLLVTSIQCLAADAGQESWSNFPRERQRLLDLIADTRANGVILLSGDRHWAELSKVDPSHIAYPLYELTSSSLNQIHPRGTPTKNANRADPATFHLPNYGLIQIDWSQPRLHVLLQIRDVDSRVKLQKSLSINRRNQ